MSSSRDLLAPPGHHRPVWLSRVPPTPMGQQRCADQPDLKFAPRTAPGQTRHFDRAPLRADAELGQHNCPIKSLRPRKFEH
jgi:hypothetical protein